MDRKVFTLLLVFLFSLFCVNATAQVEYVFSNIVADNAIFIEALDGWFASDDSPDSQKLEKDTFSDRKLADRRVFLCPIVERSAGSAHHLFGLCDRSTPGQSKSRAGGHGFAVRSIPAGPRGPLCRQR